jgi:uncharacterized protein YfdQ (DUF2303 family)
MLDTENENIAATLKRILPTASLLPGDADPALFYKVAVPEGFKIEQIDLEKLLPNPRRMAGIAKFSDAPSLVAYLATHKRTGSTVWCDFNPQTFALSFSAVLDEHATAAPGWRGHRATHVPDMSAEWKAWKSMDGKPFDQVAFAEWIEEHADDITTANGLPTSLEMLKMATDFQANENRVLKSNVKLQSGGVRLTYIADPEAGTTEDMKLFEKFSIGIPVFQGGAAWSMTARLKFRLKGGTVNFHYELVRADRVHQGAALELIGQVRDAIGDVPLLMGALA